MILFIDIETAPISPTYADLSDDIRKHWDKKSQFLRLKEEEKTDSEKAYRGHAGIFAEWSKVICIGLGYYSKKHKKIKTHAISGHDEMELLENLRSYLSKFREKGAVQFCGHNIKEFDLPFLCRRFVIHSIPLPDELQLAGLKPWENTHIDTMNLWRFGEYKRYTSLDLLATILGIPSPKMDIDGSQVANVYYNDNDLQRIVDYCLRDVETTAKVYFRLKGNSPKEL